jgi:integrase
MGHVVKTPAGTYRANWRDATGKQKAKTFRTKKEANAFITETEASMRRGGYVDPHAGQVRFGTYAATWEKSRNVEARTSERTESVMRVHVLPQWERWPLSSIQHAAVQDWVNGLRATMAPWSVAKCFGAFSMVLDSAVQARLIQADPCDGVKLPSTYRASRPAMALTRDEVFGKLLPAVHPAYRALVSTPAGTGLRWGECLGLTWAAVDFKAETLRVVQVVIESGGKRLVKPFPKSKAGLRTVPMPSFLAAELRRLQEAKDGPDGAELVFTTRSGQPPLRGTFRREIWRPALVRAGLLGRVEHLGECKYRATWPDASGTEWSSEHTTERDAVETVATKAAGGHRFHDLRHSYATWLVSDGLPVNVVQRVMGHENPSTTLNLYTHAASQFEDRVRDVFKPPADDSLTDDE